MEQRKWVICPLRVIDGKSLSRVSVSKYFSSLFLKKLKIKFQKIPTESQEPFSKKHGINDTLRKEKEKNPRSLHFQKVYCQSRKQYETSNVPVETLLFVNVR